MASPAWDSSNATTSLLASRPVQNQRENLEEAMGESRPWNRQFRTWALGWGLRFQGALAILQAPDCRVVADTAVNVRGTPRHLQ